MSDIFKTIIIGAGPGGLNAGRYLEEALILDQKKEIGEPVQCGEGISKESLERQRIKPDPSWISAVIDTTQFISPSGKKVEIEGKESGFIIDRVLFEKFLASQSKAGVLLEKRVVDVSLKNGIWEVKTEKGEVFKSKYLIGADGSFSIVRNKVFNEKLELLPTLEYLVELEKEIPTSIMRLYFDREKFPSGYAWIFPKSKKTANAGLGGEKNLKEGFKYLMEDIVKKEFGNYKLLKNKSGVISWGGAKIKLFKNNAFLVGDAGGLVDPIFGGGMNNAMISGKIAAECINSGKANLYEKKIKSLPFFSKDLLLAQEILYSLPNPVLDELTEIEIKSILSTTSVFSILSQFLSKLALRKNFLKVLKLFLILKKNIGSFAV